MITKAAALNSPLLVFHRRRLQTRHDVVATGTPVLLHGSLTVEIAVIKKGLCVSR